MKRKSITPLGETEMEVLQHVWDLGHATVADVQARIQDTRKVAYTTILTVLRNLTKKGYVTYRKDGATYVYSPARKPNEVRSGLLDSLIQKVFRGSPLALVQTLVRHEDLTDEERAAIRKMIDHMEDDDANRP